MHGRHAGLGYVERLGGVGRRVFSPLRRYRKWPPASRSREPAAESSPCASDDSRPRHADLEVIADARA